MRPVVVASLCVLLGACESLSDAWVRRDFSRETDVAGFSQGTSTFFRAFFSEPGPDDPPLHPATTEAMQRACQRPQAAAERTRATRAAALGVSGAIAAAAILTVGEMILVEVGAQLDQASDRLVEDLTSASGAAVNVPRLSPGFGSACFVVGRSYSRSNVDRGRLWEFGFIIQGLETARGAIVVQPISFVFERSAALTQNGENIDVNITVNLHAPTQNDTMGLRGSSDFRIRGVRPTGSSTASPQVPARAIVPRVGTAFVGPGDRFSVISVAVTEMGVGGGTVKREQAFRQRHQEAVISLARAIAADRLSVERLPGR